MFVCAVFFYVRNYVYLRECVSVSVCGGVSENVLWCVTVQRLHRKYISSCAQVEASFAATAVDAYALVCARIFMCAIKCICVSVCV